MQPKIHWKKKLFTNSYNIYSNNHLIGKLIEKTFSQSSDGEYEDKKYVFKTRGFFKQHTSIIDRSQNKIIGEIHFGNWMTRATISINGETFHWKYDNFFNTKWRIFNAEGAEIKYNGSSTGGQIDTNIDNSILILSGLFVKNYYLEMSIAIFIAIFIPIWVTVIN